MAGNSEDMDRARMMADLGMDRVFAIATADEPRQRASQALQRRTRNLDKARREDILAHANDEKAQGIVAWHDPTFQNTADTDGERPEFADGQSHRSRLQEKMRQDNWDRTHHGAGHGQSFAPSVSRRPSAQQVPQRAAGQRTRAISPCGASPHYNLRLSKGRVGSGSIPRNGPTLATTPSRAPDPREAGVKRFVRGRVVSSNSVANTTRVQALRVPTAVIASSLSRSGLLASTSSSTAESKKRMPSSTAALAPCTRSALPASDPALHMKIKHCAGEPRDEVDEFCEKHPQHAQAVRKIRTEFYREALIHAANPTSGSVKYYYSGLQERRRWMLLEAIKAKDLVESGDAMAIREYCAIHPENSDLIDLAETLYFEDEAKAIKKLELSKKPTAISEKAVSSPTASIKLATMAPKSTAVGSFPPNEPKLKVETPVPKNGMPRSFSTTSEEKTPCVAVSHDPTISAFGRAFEYAARMATRLFHDQSESYGSEPAHHDFSMIGDARLDRDGVWVVV